MGLFYQRSQPSTDKPSQTGHGGDELRDLAETFCRTVARLSALMQQAEEAHQKALQAEIDKKQFYREVIRAVTQGKFELVDPEELPTPGEITSEIPLREGKDYAAARRAITQCGAEFGMDEDRTAELVLAAGEAITNTLKHARDGRCSVYRSPESLAVRVADQGSGIQSQHLAAAILMPGFSTKVSLGMGYTLMLRLCDRVWLATGPEGTVVQLEKRIVPVPNEEASHLNAVLERL